jgi:Undecaprenyl-phosphate galactose phosphotransferase WbaP
MQAVTVNQVDPASSGWFFTTKLRIGFNFFGRCASNSAVLLGSDVIALLLAFETAAVARWVIMGSPMVQTWILWIAGFWAIGAALWGLLPGWGLSPVESLRRQVLLTCASFAAAAVLLFLAKTGIENSRFTFMLAFGLAVPLVPFFRMMSKRMLIRYRIWGIPVAVYGGGDAGRTVLRALQDEPGQGYYPVCVFDDDSALQNMEIEGVPVRGATDSIAQNVPIAILAMTRIANERISELMEGALSSYLRVMIIPNIVHIPSLWVTSRDLSGIPGLEMANNLLDPSKRIFKRTVEMAATLLTFPLWGPLCGLIAALIWLEDRANPIFRQTRMGQGDSVFETFKFRTMVPDAEAVLQEHLDTDPAIRAEWERHCKLLVDPRITRVGNFLRRTSLDELPQLFNVLRGEMSLVGPRPLPAYHYEQLPESTRRLRERVKPGMTGMWQVSGRSDAGNDGMIRWDPYYVRNWSLWLDIVILVRTFKVVLAGSGAR